MTDDEMVGRLYATVIENIALKGLSDDESISVLDTFRDRLNAISMEYHNDPAWWSDAVAAVREDRAFDRELSESSEDRDRRQARELQEANRAEIERRRAAKHYDLDGNACLSVKVRNKRNVGILERRADASEAIKPSQKAVEPL